MVIHPDDTTAFVANRADATVVKVNAVDTLTPLLDASLAVGSEPTGLALSPTGAKLFVAEFAEGRISVIDTETMELLGFIDAPRNPRSVTVTNDGDGDDDDETIIVAEFFGAPTGTEATDTSREGEVRFYSVESLEPIGLATLAPIETGFTSPDGSPGGANNLIKASPNQLYMAGVVGDRVLIPSVSASPAGKVKFNANVQPVVYAVDITSFAEDTSARGSTNLARLVKEDLTGEGKLFLAEPVDIGFVGADVAYVVSRGADILQRVTYGEQVTLGSSANEQIELNTVPSNSERRCQNPTGVVISHGEGRAYVNCWVSRALGVVDLASQSLQKTVAAADLPSGESEEQIQLGRRFFFTGRGRWSDNGWSSCGSCHPDGWTDNMTWSFAAGPRQSTSLDGSFSKGPGPQKQRVLNWTGIFDEIHDFERNTRGVSGGLGAVTFVRAGECGDLGAEIRADLAGGLGQPVKEVQDRAILPTCTTDWDDIEAFVKTIRPPRGRRFLDSESVARGALLFGAGGTESGFNCVKCHGGAGWTVSRLFFEPSSNGNSDQVDLLRIGPELGTGRAPDQVRCAIHPVGTFGDAALEIRDTVDAGGNTVIAQGEDGYNVPSLYGLSVGAPFLHHGGARSLEDLFDAPGFQDHLTSGFTNPPSGDLAQKKADLINFLLSIDADTPEQALPPGADPCEFPL